MSRCRASEVSEDAHTKPLFALSPMCISNPRRLATNASKASRAYLMHVYGGLPQFRGFLRTYLQHDQKEGGNDMLPLFLREGISRDGILFHGL